MIPQEYLKNLTLRDAKLLSELDQHGQLAEVPKGTEILSVGQYVKVIPLVAKGLVKVYSQYQDKELLLYYIQPNESCVMSFAAGIENGRSSVSAITEEDCVLILLPALKVQEWVAKYTAFNELFFAQYNLRYTELISTMNHLLFDTLEEKVWEYLSKKVKVEQNHALSITHKEISHDLGTSREVISRILKKLESQGRLKLHLKGIEVSV